MVMLDQDRPDPRNSTQRTAKLSLLTVYVRPLHRSNWSKVWTRAVRLSELPRGFGLHGLRHYFATLLIHSGGSVNTVQLA